MTVCVRYRHPSLCVLCLVSMAVLRTTASGSSPVRAVNVPIQAPLGEDVSQQFVRVVQTNFAEWDTNGDGRLDESEATRLMQSPRITGDAAAAVAAIKIFLSTSRAPSPAALTKTFFGSAKSTLSDIVTVFSQCKARLQKCSGVPVFTADGPQLTGIKQAHGIGDCYLIAAIGAVLARDSSAIRNMIVPDSQRQTYRVVFPDGAWVTVLAPTDAELAWYRGAGPENGVWLRLLEKAFGARELLLRGVDGDATVDPFEVIYGPKSHIRAMEAMTGHTIQWFDYPRSGNTKRPILANLSQLRGVLYGASYRHRIVNFYANNSADVPSIYHNHAYAMLNYSPESDSVTIWNPAGNSFTPRGPEGLMNGYSTLHGEFTVPLADLPVLFDGPHVETDQEAPTTTRYRTP